MDNTTFRAALSQIFREYGTRILADPDKLVALFADFAPTLKKEQKLLKHVSSAGLLSSLLKAMSSDSAEQTRACEVLVDKMHEDLFVDENIAAEFVGDIAAALGWNFAPKKSAVQSAPQAQSAPQPQAQNTSFDAATIAQLQSILSTLTQQTPQPQTPPTPAPNPAPQPPASSGNCSVMLHSVGNNKIHVVKIVCEAGHYSLKDAKELVERAPVVIASNIPYQSAMRIVQQLSQVGAIARLVSF